MAPPSTLILGSAKSGTTALFYAIRAAMNRATGHDVKGLFEPRKMDAYRRYFKSTDDPVFLCKALLGPAMRNMQSALDRFDRRIVIYRDPRDNIVSRLLFMPPRLLFGVDQTKCDDYLDLIRQKQADPGSLSVLAILRALEGMSGRDNLLTNFRDNAVMPARIQRTYGDRFWMFAYDDLLNGCFDRLSAYLGIEVTADFKVDSQHGYVSRSMSSGEWRSWFLPEDIAYFAHDVAEDYVLLGFDPTESADPTPQISPETSSDYAHQQVERLETKNRSSRVRRRLEARATAVPDAVLTRQRRRAQKQAKTIAASTEKSVDASADKVAAEARRARRLKRNPPVNG